jgi:hypothetical protein
MRTKKEQIIYRISDGKPSILCGGKIPDGYSITKPEKKLIKASESESVSEQLQLED